MNLLKKVYKKVQKDPRRKESATPPSQPHAIRRRLTADQVSEIVLAYQRGSTPTELSKTFSLSKSALVFLLHDHGLAIRTKSLTPEQKNQARVLRAEGHSYVSLGVLFGVHKSTVWHAVNSGHRAK